MKNLIDQPKNYLKPKLNKIDEENDEVNPQKSKNFVSKLSKSIKKTFED